MRSAMRREGSEEATLTEAGRILQPRRIESYSEGRTADTRHSHKKLSSFNDLDDSLGSEVRLLTVVERERCTRAWAQNNLHVSGITTIIKALLSLNNRQLFAPTTTPFQESQ